MEDGRLNLIRRRLQLIDGDQLVSILSFSLAPSFFLTLFRFFYTYFFPSFFFCLRFHPSLPLYLLCLASCSHLLYFTILLGTILSSDHTFKIAKKVFIRGSHRMYKAASLIFNEYGQIAAFYLLTSKKNTELNGYLLKLNERYRKGQFNKVTDWLVTED